MTALKTVAMRLRGTSTEEMEEEGLDTDGAVTSKSKLQSKIKGLSGVDILTDTGAYKSTYQILSEIADVWESMNDMDQAALLELLAGKRAGSVMSAILENPETLKDAFESANDASGSALEENEKYMDSIQGRLDQFNNSLQTMWNNELNSDVIKWFVGFGKVLIEAIDKLGLVPSAFIAISLAIMKMNHMNPMEYFESINHSVANLGTQIKSRIKGLKGWITGTQQAAAATQTWTDNTIRQAVENNVLTSTQAVRTAMTNGVVLSEISLTKADAASLLSTTNLTKTEQQAVISKLRLSNTTKQLTLDMLHQKVMSGELSASIAAQTAQAFGLIGASAQLTASKAREMMISWGVVKSEQQEIIKALELDGTLKQLTMDNILLALSNQTLDPALLKTSLRLLQVKDSAAAAGFSLKGMLKAMAPMFVVMQVVQLATKAWELFDEKVLGSIDTFENAQEEFEELNNDLDNIKSELRSLESELDSTNDRIDELRSQETLSLVEEEELNNLEKQTKELERQIELQKTLQKQQQKAVSDQALKTMEMYQSDTSFYSDKTKTERQQEAEENGKTWGTAAGLGIGAVIGGFFGQPVLGAAIGSAVLSPVLGAVFSASEGSNYNSELTVGQALDDMSSIRASLQTDVDAARDAINASTNATIEQKEALQEAEQALADFETGLGNSINQINQYLNSIDYSMLTDDSQKQKYLDNLKYSLKYNIEYGIAGAKTMAANTLLDEKYITDELQQIKDQIELKISLDEDFNFTDIKIPDEARKQLADAGLTVTDLQIALEEEAKAEEKALNLDASDMVSEVAKVTDNITALKDAFEEFNESGLVTAKTLQTLNESFGNLDSWENYLEVMSSGVASTQEAMEVTKEMATEALTDMLSNPLTLVDDTDTEENDRIEGYKTLITLANQLQSIGVTGAWDLVNAMNEKAVAKTVADEIKLYDDLIEKKKLGQKLSEDEQKFLDKGNLSMEQRIKAAEEKYGIEIQSTDAIQTQIDLLKVQEDLKEIKKHSTNFNGGNNDYYKQYLTSIEEIGNLLDDAEEASKQAEKYLDSVSFGDTVLESITFGLYSEASDASEQADIQQDIVDGALNNIDAIKEKLQDNFEEMKDIAEEAGDEINLEGINLNVSDISTPEGLKVYKQLYDKIKPYIEEKQAELESQEEELKEKLNTAFTEIGVEVTLELLDKNKLVDDIQSVFDTLKDAVKEFNEEGYLSVDTAQMLLDPTVMDPKYLTLLADENGQLKLNEQALYDIAIARLTDLGVKQQDAILTQAEELAKAGAIEKLRESTEALYGEADALQAVNMARIDSIRKILEEKQVKGELAGFDIDAYITNLTGQVNAVGNIITSAKDNIHNTLSSSGNTAKAEAEDAFQKAMDYWENRIGANQARYEQIQNEIDLLEKQGKIVGKEYYQEQIKLENQRLKLLEAQKAEAKKFLGTFKTGSDEWWEAANQLNDIEGEIDSVTSSIQDLNDAMNQIKWTIFDEAHERFDNLISQLQNVREALSADEDAFFDDEGNWSETGVAVLGTYIQEIEHYKNSLADVEKELANLNKVNPKNAKSLKNAGFDSEQEYYDKVQELIDKQNEYTLAIIDSEQSVVDMYESQIDAIEEYTDKLVDSYNEYIDLVREALDAERD